MSKAWAMTGKALNDRLGYGFFDSYHFLHRKYSGTLEDLTPYALARHMYYCRSSFNGTAPDYPDSPILVIRFPLPEGYDEEFLEAELNDDIDQALIELYESKEREQAYPLPIVIYRKCKGAPDEMSVDLICPYAKIYPGLPIHIADMLKTEDTAGVYGSDADKYALNQELRIGTRCFLNGDDAVLLTIESMDETGVILRPIYAPGYPDHIDLDWEDIDQLEII